jgi:uncharacterized membrane protein (DUF2068 family)
VASGKNPLTTTSVDRPAPAPTLYGIAVFKLGKGLLLLLLGLGVYSLAGDDLRDQFDAAVRWIRLDPENQFFSRLSDWLEQVTPRRVRWIAFGTLFYSLFSLIEGGGLALRQGWAGWLAIGESGLFIPLEVADLCHGFSKTILLVLVLNIIIFWYLLQNRKRIFRHHFPGPSTEGPDRLAS